MTTCLQQQAEWISNCIKYLREHKLKVCEPTREAEDKWVQHHEETAAATLVQKTVSWYMGLQRDGQAAAPAVLHRRRRTVPAEVR